MDKDDFELLGFTTETLPSGYINLINKQPFHYNGCKTICCYRGGIYVMTTNHKSLDSILSTLRELRTVDPSSVNSTQVAKKKTKTVKTKKEDAFEAVTDQDLTAFLVSESEAPVKTRRRRKA